MTERCTPELKQHMWDIFEEYKMIERTVRHDLHRLSKRERVAMGERMTQIVKEMVEFRKAYPDD
jgi:hypothetical protein